MVLQPIDKIVVVFTLSQLDLIELPGSGAIGETQRLFTLVGKWWRVKPCIQEDEPQSKLKETLFYPVHGILSLNVRENVTYTHTRPLKYTLIGQANAHTIHFTHSY